MPTTSAPAWRAIWAAWMPTPPSPISATRMPAATSPRVTTARYAVPSAQVIGPALSVSTESGIGSSRSSGTTTRSAKPPLCVNPIQALRFVQRFSSPARQRAQRPQGE
jgi:hypothetical protein